MNIREIVFPVDFSVRSVETCAYVAALTQLLQAKLTLLHVVENPPGRSNASEALGTFRQQHISEVDSELCVVPGDPSEGIVLRGGEGCMIVMPTHGRSSFGQSSPGSVTEKVLQDSKCPVLTGPDREMAAECFRPRRVLSAVDLEPEMDGVLRKSARIAGQLGAALIAFHVVTAGETGLPPFADAGISLTTHSARSELRDALNRTGILGQTCVSVGEPAAEIARAARAFDSDMIVIGKSRAGTRVYGIIREAPCPVLCV